MEDFTPTPIDPVGADGWLYGAQGSTVTANIQASSFSRAVAIARTKQFELFSEGGGNTWGLDFDRHGNAIASTNWGGFANLHQVQGGYYITGFGKHGPLHNPHTYGYFDHILQGLQGRSRHRRWYRLPRRCAPSKYHNQFIAANLLSNVINWHVMEPNGSTFTAPRRHAARCAGRLVSADRLPDRAGWGRLRRRLVRRPGQPCRSGGHVGPHQWSHLQARGEGRGGLTGIRPPQSLVARAGRDADAQ
jgi:hypothetical protein